MRITEESWPKVDRILINNPGEITLSFEHLYKHYCFSCLDSGKVLATIDLKDCYLIERFEMLNTLEGQREFLARYNS